MKVRILKAERSSWWYYKLIGQIIDIPDDYTITNDGDYKFLRPSDESGRLTYHYLGLNDCEIVEHSKPKNTHGDSKLKFYFI